jgi:hypothetical protein
MSANAPLTAWSKVSLNKLPTLMQALYERFIEQLNSLIAFMALSQDEIFSLLCKRYKSWIPKERQDAIPQKLAAYQTQVAHAAFLLGYSYAEAFLNDVAREIYLKKPQLLPGDEKIRFKEILGLSDYDDVLRHMVETTLFLMLRGSMKEIIRHFEAVLQLPIEETHRKAMVEASMIRNCIIHKMAIADDRLAELSTRWRLGEAIELTAADVHSFGVVARSVGAKVREQALKLYGQ